MTENWISLREFARRRGVALSAVQKAIESKRVTAVRRSASGRLIGIDAVLGAIQWDQNTDPAEAAKNGKFAGADLNVIPHARESGVLPLGDSEPGAAQRSAAANTVLSATVGHGAADADESTSSAGAVNAEGKDPHGYLEARADRERLTVALQALDYQKALGVLVSADEVRRLSARRYRAIRDRLLNIPDRVAAVLAAERDPAQVHAQLTAELKRVLHELSDDARAEAAGGPAERVAA